MRFSCNIVKWLRMGEGSGKHASDHRLELLFQRYERERIFSKLPHRQLEGALWGAFPSRAYNELIWRTDSQDPAIRDRALWLLARWAASEGRYHDCLDFLEFSKFDDPNTAGKRAILKAFAWSQVGGIKEAQSLARSLPPDVSTTDRLLVHAFTESGIHRLNALNRIYSKSELINIITNDMYPLDLENIYCDIPRIHNGECLSVIVPAYNCSKTLSIAIKSIVSQSWNNIDVIIVDDGSTDDTYNVATEIASRDQRVRVLQQGENRGAYAARNAGLGVAVGKYVTIHDADDWSHPSKFELQIKALASHPISTTMGVRVTPGLQPIVKASNSSILVENLSSLMGLTEDFRKLGGWDQVRAGADSEFYERIRIALDTTPNIVLPGVPLTLIRSDPTSLTQQKATGLKTINYGCRREYRESYRAWHLRADKFTIGGRAPFAAPRLVTRNSDKYDVVAIMDFSQVEDDLIAELRLYMASGKRIGLVNSPLLANIGKAANEGIRCLLCNPTVDTIVPGDEVYADMIVYSEERSGEQPESMPIIHGVIRTTGCDVRRSVRESANISPKTHSIKIGCGAIGCASV